MKKLIVTLPVIALLAACGGADEATKDAANAANDTAKKVVEYVAPDSLPAKFEGAAAATYSLEKTHAFLTASVSHGGLSDYRMDFTEFDAKVTFDPSDASANKVEFTVNPASIVTHYPGDYKAGHANTGFETWDEQLSRDAKFFNTDQFPSATFKSTSVKRTGDYSAHVTGDLTFLGVSKPVTFDVTYNGVGNKPWYGEKDLIGLNAKATISRSGFGLTALKGGIGDEVTISFSGEFLQD